MREKKCMEINTNSYRSEFVLVSSNYPLSSLVYVWESGCIRLFFRDFILFPEIVGSDGTPYAGGSFRLEIHLPER